MHFDKDSEINKKKINTKIKKNTIIFVRCKFHFVRREFHFLFIQECLLRISPLRMKQDINKIFYTPSSNTNRQLFSVRMYLTLTEASSDTSNMYRKVLEQDLAHCLIHYLLLRTSAACPVSCKNQLHSSLLTLFI